MRKNIDPFLYNVPSIDIHGYDRFGAVAMVNNFIENNIRIDSKKVIIVHGKGEGILKKSVHDYLDHNKKVLEYKINIFNDGETIVILK